MGGRFVYFLDDPEAGAKQKEERLFLLLRRESPVSDVDAVALLVQFIKHPEASVEELTAMLAGKGRRVAPPAIREFLEQHDLLKKKLRVPGDPLV